MKKVIVLLIALVFTTQAQAKSIWDSEWFEPTLFCAVGGAAGYASQSDGESSDQAIYGAVGCGVGALLGYLINKRYQSKYGEQYQEELKAMQKTIREMQVQQAQRGESLDLEANDYLIQKEIVPGKKLPNGDIMSPTIKYRLVNPGQNLRIGE